MREGRGAASGRLRQSACCAEKGPRRVGPAPPAQVPSHSRPTTSPGPRSCLQWGPRPATDHAPDLTHGPPSLRGSRAKTLGRPHPLFLPTPQSGHRQVPSGLPLRGVQSQTLPPRPPWRGPRHSPRSPPLEAAAGPPLAPSQHPQRPTPGPPSLPHTGPLALDWGTLPPASSALRTPDHSSPASRSLLPQFTSRLCTGAAALGAPTSGRACAQPAPAPARG